MEFEDSTPLVISCARYGELEELKTCVANGESLHCKDEYGNTALHMACANGAVDVVTFIIEALRDDPQRTLFINSKNKNGSTALHWAALNGHGSIVEVLINANSNISIEDVQGKSAYYYAEQNHHEDVLSILLDAMEQQGFLKIEEIEDQDDDEDNQIEQESLKDTSHVSELNNPIPENPQN